MWVVDGCRIGTLMLTYVTCRLVQAAAFITIINTVDFWLIGFNPGLWSEELCTQSHVWIAGLCMSFHTFWDLDPAIPIVWKRIFCSPRLYGVWYSLP